MIIQEIYEKATDIRVKALKLSRKPGYPFEHALEYYVEHTIPLSIAYAILSYLRKKSGKERTNALIKITAAARALSWDSDEGDNNPNPEQEESK